MQSDLSGVERRVKRYWFTDGIGELIGGGMLALLGVYFVLQQFLEKFLTGSSLTTLLLQNGFFLLVFIGGWLIAQRLINFLKTRLTYPRTGYVEYQTHSAGTSKWGWILYALLSATLSAFIVMLAYLLRFFDAVAAVTGLIGAWVFVIMRTRSSGLTRFNVLAGISLVLGLVLSVSGLPVGYNAGLFYGLMGICVSISGGWTLRCYLQSNSMPVEE
ncbi:MAG: hypothetical protein ACM33V_02115 [Chloroflexota bacterium]|nr:hypothetical protein [Anaerolineales bacterium]